MTDLSKKFLANCELRHPPENVYYSCPVEYWQGIAEENVRLRPLIELAAKVIEEAEALRVGFKLGETLDALREEVERE